MQNRNRRLRSAFRTLRRIQASASPPAGFLGGANRATRMGGGARPSPATGMRRIGRKQMAGRRGKFSSAQGLEKSRNRKESCPSHEVALASSLASPPPSGGLAVASFGARGL